MRLHSKWEKENVTINGGGTKTPKPTDVKIEPTGSILQVFYRFGHLMTGRVAFDSDMLSESNGAVKTAVDNNGLDDKYASDDNAVDDNAVDDNAADDISVVHNNGMAQAIAGTPRPTAKITSDAYAALMQDQNRNETAPSIVAQTPSTAANPSSQFFPTNSQRRRPINVIHAKQMQFWEMRCEYIEQQKQQAVEWHEKRMQHRQQIFQQQMAFWNAATAHRSIGAAAITTDCGNIFTENGITNIDTDANATLVINTNTHATVTDVRPFSSPLHVDDMAEYLHDTIEEHESHEAGEIDEPDF